MSLSSSQLDAFAAVARLGSFSKAAVFLRVTQSALSQRILNLEDELGIMLIVRDPAGLRLTPAGEEMLRYHQMRSSLESEVLGRLKDVTANISGVVRIGGFSSTIRSVVLPAIAPLLSRFPGVRLELVTRELRDLGKLLTSGEVDFLLTTQTPLRSDVVSTVVGAEENVLIESKHHKVLNQQYLDHDTDDMTTSEFLKYNGKSVKVARSYLDEVYTIIDGVRMGIGRAVVSRHLVENDGDIRIVKGYKSLKTDIYLQYFQQPYYSKLHEEVIRVLSTNAKKYLS